MDREAWRGSVWEKEKTENRSLLLLLSNFFILSFSLFTLLFTHTHYTRSTNALASRSSHLYRKNVVCASVCVCVWVYAASAHITLAVFVFFEIAPNMKDENYPSLLLLLYQTHDSIHLHSENDAYPTLSYSFLFILLPTAHASVAQLYEFILSRSP